MSRQMMKSYFKRDSHKSLLAYLRDRSIGCLVLISLLATAVQCSHPPSKTLTPSNGPDRIKAILDQLSVSDKEILKDYFQTMLFESIGAAVLFGNKPLGCEEYDPGYRCGVRFTSDHFLRECLHQGAEVLQRLAPQLNGHRFSMVFQNPASAPKDTLVETLWINHRAVLETVDEHLTLFQVILGPQATPEKLLDQLLNPDLDLCETLQQNHILWGLLFGFGTQNTLYAGRTFTLKDDVCVVEKVPLKPRGQRFSEWYPKVTSWSFRSKRRQAKQLRPGFGYENVGQEYGELAALTIPTYQHPLAQDCLIPTFACIPDSEETLTLLSKYKAAANEAYSLGPADKFLENVLAYFVDP